MYRLLAITAALLFTTTLNAQAGQNGSTVLVDGEPSSNSYAGQRPAALEAWCEGICIPLVTLEMLNISKSKPIGVLHTWGKNFRGAGMSIQFDEFIIYELKGGEFYTASGADAPPTAAPIPTDLLTPKVGAQVWMGGTEGVVLPGTGKYKRAGGAYSTRLKPEFDEAGNIVYYDELLFRFREVKVN